MSSNEGGDRLINQSLCVFVIMLTSQALSGADTADDRDGQVYSGYVAKFNS